jgi:hypothetical protein
MNRKTVYATELLESFVLDIAKKRRNRSPQYNAITDDRIRASFCRAIGYNLRYCRETNIMRDSSGWLSKPSAPSEWPEATLKAAQEYIANEIWCSAVTSYNRETMR